MLALMLFALPAMADNVDTGNGDLVQNVDQEVDIGTQTPVQSDVPAYTDVESSMVPGVDTPVNKLITAHPVNNLYDDGMIEMKSATYTPYRTWTRVIWSNLALNNLTIN
jgi:hypothetical protein